MHNVEDHTNDWSFKSTNSVFSPPLIPACCSPVSIQSTHILISADRHCTTVALHFLNSTYYFKLIQGLAASSHNIHSFIHSFSQPNSSQLMSQGPSRDPHHSFKCITIPVKLIIHVFRLCDWKTVTVHAWEKTHACTHRENMQAPHRPSSFHPGAHTWDPAVLHVDKQIIKTIIKTGLCEIFSPIQIHVRFTDRLIIFCCG